MLAAGVFISLLMLLSLILSVFHLPESFPSWLAFWRPQWILLALILWVQHVPQYRGSLFRFLFTKNASDDGTIARRLLSMVWLFGLYLDTLMGEPFGLNGAICAGIAFYLLRYQDRLQLQTLFQQMIMVFMMVFLAEVLRGYVLNSVSGQPWDLQPLTLAVSSMLLWPACSWLARSVLGTPRRT